MKWIGKRWGCLAVAAVLALSALTAYAADENSTEIPIYGVESSSSSEASSEPAPPEEEEPESPSSTPDEPEQIPDEPSAEAPPTDLPLVTEKLQLDLNPVRAKVTSILDDEALADGLFPERTQDSVVFEATIEEGVYTGTTVNALRDLDAAGAAFSHPLRPGEIVYLTLYWDSTETLRSTFSDFSRFPSMIWVAMAAAVLLLLCIRRRSGVKLLGLLAVSGLLIGFLLVPWPTLPIACLTLGLIALLATVLFYGIKYRTVAAYISILLSLAVTGGVAFGLTKLFRLSGIWNPKLLSEFFTPGMTIHFPELLIAAILFSVLGALIVVCNAASAGAEPQEELNLPKAAFWQGMRRGAVAMTPAAMTLCFVLAAGLIGLLALLHAAGAATGRMLSDESVASVLTALTSCLSGLAASVPLSAGISVLLLRWRTREDGSLREFQVAQTISEKEQGLFGKAAEKLDDAIRTAVGETEQAERDIEEAETKLDRELEAEEAALEKEEQREKDERQEQHPSAPKKKRKTKRPPKKPETSEN